MSNLNPNTVQDRAANIMKMFGRDIIKGGVGSGRKIGTTRSGKDIYDTFEHPEHKDFDKKDHEDAENKHSLIASMTRRTGSENKKGELLKRVIKNAKIHEDNADLHRKEKNKK